jgi:MarR family transcriptional regulator, 2-MHQ and catechol-resistance regulon repressor
VDRCPNLPRTPVAGSDDPAIGTYGRLVEVARRLERTFSRSIAAATGLPDAQFELLLRLGRSPGDELTMSDLARQLGVAAGGATRLVDRVLLAGLVERRGCPTDRRVHHVRLTTEGRDTLAAALAIHRRDLARELTDRLDADERAELERLLDRLRTDADVAGVPEASPVAVERPRTW